MSDEEPYDGTFEYVRGKVEEAIERLDDERRGPLQARVRDAALLLATAFLREEQLNMNAWASYVAFREMTTTQPGSIERTTALMSGSQADAASRLLRRLKESLGPSVA